MIYCRQCRIACEHKYSLCKLPKKGEKVRWYCEDYRPTIFPRSIFIFSKEAEVDAETCKLYPESIQKLQNHNPDLKNNNLDAFCPSQLETVREEAEIITWIRAKHGEETNASRLSRCTEIRKSKPVQNKKENDLNQQDREKSNYSTRSKTRGDQSRKRERSTYEDQAYNKLTKRQKALYDSENKEQNRDKPKRRST